MRTALIGLGGIGSIVLAMFQKNSVSPDNQIVAAVVSAADLESTQRRIGTDIPVYTELDDLWVHKPQLVAECAGHSAVSQYGRAVLERGLDLLIISTGALADETLLNELQQVAREQGCRILIPAGAVGGIDALAAARLAGIEAVTYRAIKPASAWSGTPAEQILDLGGMSGQQCFYRGTAREAALSYPKNSNVAATIALAGAGFDKTMVELIADADGVHNIHELDVQARSGTFNIQLAGSPLEESPKTSALAAYSVAKCLLDQTSGIII